MGRDAGIEKEVEMLRNQLKEKNAEIETLRKQVESQSDKSQGNLLNVIEIMAKSRDNSPYPSRPVSPAPAYSKE